MSTATTTAVKTLTDGATVARRNLIKIKRVPDLLVFSTMSPIMFILLFAYVFGSAIPIPGISYREFLMPGIFAQTVIFGATITGAGMADDMQKGIIDRFRSLPMAQSAVLVGRTGSDLINNVLVMVIMSLTGLLVGWRIHTSVAEAAVGFLLLVHGDLPAHLRGEHLRADEQVPTRTAGHRGLESGVRGDPGRASAVREHHRQAADAARVVAATSDRLHPDLDSAPAGDFRSGVLSALQEGR
jgi:ABC-2 family transporter